METSSITALRKMDEVRPSKSKRIQMTEDTVMPKPKPLAQQQQQVDCPRCHSSNTKFCYFNNYSKSQPRYFCKACRRYWTHGGNLRNVPIGGGCRKSKRSSSTSASVSAPASTPASNINNMLASEPVVPTSTCMSFLGVMPTTTTTGFEFPISSNNLSMDFGLPSSLSEPMVPSAPSGGLSMDLLGGGLFTGSYHNNMTNYYGLNCGNGMATTLSPSYGFGGLNLMQNGGLGATFHANGGATTLQAYLNLEGGSGTMGTNQIDRNGMRVLMGCQWSSQVGAGTSGGQQQHQEQGSIMNSAIMGSNGIISNNNGSPVVDYFWNNESVDRNNTAAAANPWHSLMP